MSKRTERITVVLDAEFGGDPADQYDRDDNAYTHSRHANILGAMAAGDINPDNGWSAYLELGTGDAVRGELVSITTADPTPEPTGGRAALLTWDYREQPNLNRLAQLLHELAGEDIHLHRVNTGSDQYAIVLATTQMDEATVQATFNQWWLDDDAPEIIEITSPPPAEGR